jgi:hypothetical protein
MNISSPKRFKRKNKASIIGSLYITKINNIKLKNFIKNLFGKFGFLVKINLEDEATP